MKIMVIKMYIDQSRGRQPPEVKCFCCKFFQFNDFVTVFLWSKRCLKIMVIYMYIALGQGQTIPWDPNYLIILIISCMFLPFNDWNIFPHLNAYARETNLDLAVK